MSSIYHDNQKYVTEVVTNVFRYDNTHLLIGAVLFITIHLKHFK